MVDRHKLVVRFNQWYNPVMEERFQREPDLELLDGRPRWPR